MMLSEIFVERFAALALEQSVKMHVGTSEADMCAATSDVCFTPDSDRKSGHAPMVMSALPPKADMGDATAHVCFGP